MVGSPDREDHGTAKELEGVWVTWETENQLLLGQMIVGAHGDVLKGVAQLRRGFCKRLRNLRIAHREQDPCLARFSASGVIIRRRGQGRKDRARGRGGTSTLHGPRCLAAERLRMR